jgi:hypothetical protein
LGLSFVQRFYFTKNQKKKAPQKHATCGGEAVEKQSKNPRVIP